MFRRPYYAKPFSVLRSSDRRKMQQAFLAALPLFEAHYVLNEATTDASDAPPTAAATAAATAANKSQSNALPSQLESAKIETSQEESYTLYIDAATKDPQCLTRPVAQPDQKQQYIPSRIFILSTMISSFIESHSYSILADAVSDGITLHRDTRARGGKVGRRSRFDAARHGALSFIAKL